MYSNAEIASWLKATYGLSESIRELVPRRNVPPLLPCELDAAVAPTPTPAKQTNTVASHRFLMVPSWRSRPERRLVDRQRTCAGIERTTHSERECGEVLSVAERQLVD